MEIMSNCNSKTEIYSRITGYFRPVENWNDAKQQEFVDRKTFCGYGEISPVEILSKETEKVTA